MNRKLILSLTMVTLVIMACSKSDDDAKSTTSESLSDKAASVVKTMKETSSKVADETMEKAKSAAEETATFVKKGSSQVVTAVEDAKEGLVNTVETVKVKAADMLSESQSVDADVGNSASAATATDTASLEAGKSVYEGKSVVCHGSGAAGAPKLDDPGWSARNAQGMDILIDHALKGYKGSKGYMPAKGGFMALSDEEVKNAVAYMVETSSK